MLFLENKCNWRTNITFDVIAKWITQANSLRGDNTVYILKNNNFSKFITNKVQGTLTVKAQIFKVKHFKHNIKIKRKIWLTYVYHRKGNLKIK